MLSDTWRGVLWKLLSSACLVVVNVFAKKLTHADPFSAHLSVYMFLFWQQCFATIMILPFLLHTGRWHYVYQHNLLAQLARASTAIIGILLWYKALEHLSLAEAQAIQHFSPLVLFLGGIFVLRERVSTTKLIVLSLGIAGMILIAHPHEVEMQSSLLGMGLVVASVMMLTLWKILVKQLVGRMPPFEVTTIMMLYMPIVAFIPAVIVGGWPQGWHMPYLIGAGVFTFLADYAMAKAFALGELSVLASVGYSKMLFSLLLGYLILAESPTGWESWLGIGLITGSGLLAGFAGSPSSSNRPKTRRSS